MRVSLHSAWLLDSRHKVQRKCLLRRQVCLNVPFMSNREKDGEVFLRHFIALKFSSLHMQPYFQV